MFVKLLLLSQRDEIIINKQFKLRDFSVDADIILISPENSSNQGYETIVRLQSTHCCSLLPPTPLAINK